MNLKRINMLHNTRLRAYQLGTEGASFSISVFDHFTLVEARINEKNWPGIKWEMNTLKKKTIDVLHITSWDQDHCSYDELLWILNNLKPSTVECPSYAPHTDNGKKCLTLIQAFANNSLLKMVRVSAGTIRGMIKRPLRGQDIYYNPVNYSSTCVNDNSYVKLFRVGSFQILSLGDCESSDISEALANDEILQSEVDVMILAHHGSSEDFTTTEFLKAINPRIAISCSDFDNRYGHPTPLIRQRLDRQGIKLLTTKEGDVIAETIDKYNFKVSNYVSNNETKDSVVTRKNKTWYINDQEPT